MYIEPTEADIDNINDIISNTELKFEHFDQDTYLNELILKPWGYEYRIFCDIFYDGWKLTVNPNQSTSMHCHPKKDTILLCLGGEATTYYSINNVVKVKKGDMLYIRKGVFHQTVASSKGVHLVEIENPRNKFDLLRIKDNYGRSKKGYEQHAASSHKLNPLIKFDTYSLRESSIGNKFNFYVGDSSKADLLIKNGINILFVVVLDIHQHLTGMIKAIQPNELFELKYKENLLFITDGENNANN